MAQDRLQVGGGRLTDAQRAAFAATLGAEVLALIWLAAALTLWSMGYYMSRAWPEIRRRTS